MNDTKGGSAGRGQVGESGGWRAGRILVAALAVPVAAWIALVTAYELDMGAAWFALGLVVVPVILVGAVTTRPMAERWARDRGVALGGDVLDLLHRHLLRTRVARTLGVTLAFAIGPMVMSYYNTHIEEFRATWDRWQDFSTAGVGWVLCVLGYVIASFWAEATKPHRSSTAALAVLDERRPVDLIDLGLARVFAAYAATAVVAAVAVVAANAVTLGLSWPAASEVIVPVLTLVLAGAAATWTARRPQRAADASELAYDELTRTATVNAFVGCSVAVLAVFAVGLVTSTWTLSPWFGLVGFVYGGLAFGTWIGSGTSLVFRTRRIDALRAAS